MNTRREGWCAAVLALAWLVGGLVPAHAAPLNYLFTYQGRLQQDGSPVNSTCDFQFSLWDSVGSGAPPSGGNQIGTMQPDAVLVTEGVFTALFGFGFDAFTGDERWLQIALRCPDGSGPYTTLSPRQRLSATPYALYAPSAGSAGDLSCMGCVGPGDLASGAVTSSKIASGTIQAYNLAFTPGSVTSITAGVGLTGGTITTSGTIAANIGTTAGTVAAGNHTHDGTYWSLSGNGSTSAGANFLGTTDNQALELKVDNTRALRLEPNSTSPNVIGGYAGNTVNAGTVGATVGGGGSVTGANSVTDNYGTIGGGSGNRAGDNAGTTDDQDFATVSGGLFNVASASGATVGGGGSNVASAAGAAVGGGLENTASAPYATVGGGASNAASGDSATVGGGTLNVAAADHATVPGGTLNVASGSGSFAAGRASLATDAGSFVWGDGTRIAASQGPNTFNVLATGGMRFYFDAVGNHCDLVNTNGWSCAGASDRNAKHNFSSVDGREVLVRLAALPIQRWSYKNQRPAIQHIGPMAQDFHAAFQVGEDDTHINTVDADGVALAAIQGLYALAREQAARITAQEKTITALHSQNEQLHTRVMAVESHLAAITERLDGARSEVASWK